MTNTTEQQAVPGELYRGEIDIRLRQLLARTVRVKYAENADMVEVPDPDAMGAAELIKRLAYLPCKSGEGAGHEAQRTIEILRRALAWHGDMQRMATTREEWQQTIDEAIVWVKANPEPGRVSFSSILLDPAPDATQTREAELVAALREIAESGPFANPHAAKHVRIARAALNAGGGA